MRTEQEIKEELRLSEMIADKETILKVLKESEVTE